nr:leucine-rich repeat protein [Solobacterium sp.]
MNWKKSLNLCLSFVVAFSTLNFDMRITAEETSDPEMEEYLETDTTPEPEMTEITSDEKEDDAYPEISEMTDQSSQETNEEAAEEIELPDAEEESVAEEPAAEDEASENISSSAEEAFETEQPDYYEEPEEAESIVYATDEEDFSYVLNESTEDITITGYKGTSTVVEIPSDFYGFKVTEIRGSAFENCTEITSITIPDDVKRIEYRAFYNCTSLTTITVPRSLTEVGREAFYNCSSLTTDIPVPDGQESIEEGTFYNCSNIKNITIPDSVTHIGYHAFENCSGLTAVNIPENLTDIGYDAFYNCSGLTEITIPGTVNNIGHRAFANCTSLKTVNMPEKFTSETRIESEAFSGCPGLTSMIIPEGVTELPGLWLYSDVDETLGGMFSRCDNLKTITLPSTIRDIGRNALADLISLENIIMPERFASNTYVGDNAFSGCEKLTSITIPEGVVSLGGMSEENGSFAGCPNLKTITLPSTLERIEDYAFYDLKSVETINMPERFLSEVYLGHSAFQGCEKLTSIVIPEGVTELHKTSFYSDTYIEGVFYGCNSLSSVSLPSTLTKIGDRFFYEMTNLKTVIMPEKFTSGAVIGSLAFYGCSSLQSISIPEGAALTGAEFVEEIDDYSSTFGGCSSLETVNLPSTVTIIPHYTFSGCTSLSAIVIPEGTIEIGSYAFLNCQSLKSVQLPGTLQYIDSDAFHNCISLENVIMPEEFKPGLVIIERAFENCSGLKSIDFAEGTTEIYRAFRGCDNLTSISLPSTITKIAEEAFYHMKNLEEVKMPKHFADGATIGKCAFSGCESLKAISIPEGVTMLPDGGFRELDNYTGVFGNCYSLKSAELPKTLNYIGEYAFTGCSSLETIIIPEGVSVIGADSFEGCGLNTVYFPSTISEIRDHAFAYCGKLSSVITPDHFASGAIIHDDVFRNCNSLTTITIPEGVVNINYAFRNCDNLVEITLPSTLEEIKESYFANYKTLEKVNMPAYFVNGNVIGDSAFSGCDHLLSLSIPEGITTLPNSILYGCTSLTSISLPSTLQTIRAGAFYDCSSLTSITIPEGVTGIGRSAFYNCSSLTSITIPEKVTIIGSSAFSGCSSLASITIPDGITSIGESTFENCTNLSDVIYPSNLKEIGKNAFKNCKKYADILSLESLTSIGEEAFSRTGLEKVYIYDTPTIGTNAFSYCENLNTVLIENSDTNLSLFSGCKNIKTIYYGGSADDFLSHGGRSTTLYEIEKYTCGYTENKYDKFNAAEEKGYYLGDLDIKEYRVTACEYKQGEYSIKTEYSTNPLVNKWDIHVYFDIDADSIEIDEGSISLNNYSLNLHHVNATRLLSATPLGKAKGKTLVFTSSNKDVVSFTGLEYGNSRTLIANGPGTATITVTTEDGKYSASVEVTVIDSEKKYGRLTNINLSFRTMTIDGQAIPYSELDESIEQRISAVYNGNYECSKMVAYYVYEGNVVDFRYLDEEVGEIYDWNPSTGKLTVRIHHSGTTPEWTKEEYYVNEEIAGCIESVISEGNNSRIKIYADEEGRNEKELIQVSVFRTRTGTIDSMAEENSSYYVTVFLQDGHSALADHERFQVRDRSTFAKLSGKEGETIVFTTEDAVINEVYTKSDFNMAPAVHLDVKDDRIKCSSDNKVENVFSSPVTVSVSYTYQLPSGFEGDFSTIEDAFNISLSSIILSSENEDLFSFGENKTKMFEFEDAVDQVITLKHPLIFSTEVNFNRNYEFPQELDETDINEKITVSAEFSGGKQITADNNIKFYKVTPVDQEAVNNTRKAVENIVSVTSENPIISSYVDKETFEFLKRWAVLVMDLAARPDVSDSVKRAVFDSYSSNGETADVEETITLNLKKNHPGRYVEGNRADFTFRFHVFVVDINRYIDSDLNLSNLCSTKEVRFDCPALNIRNELFSASISANVGKFNKAAQDLIVMAKKEVVKAGLDDIFAVYDEFIEACDFVNEEEIVISNAVKSYLYVASEELVTMEETDFISLVRKMWGKDFYDKCKKDINSYHESQGNAAHDRKVKIDCPVDVYVYSGDVLVGSVINDQVVPNDHVWGSVVEADGETKYILDYGYDLTYKIVGYDEGTMNIETYVYQSDEAEGMIEPIKETGYYDLEVTNDIEYTGEIKAETDPLAEDQLICVTKEETIVPDIDTSKGDILVQSISLDHNELMLMKDETAVLTATVLPENATNRQYTWSSSNERVASVDENGTVTAHRRGNAVITARSKNGSYTADCNVTVKVELDDQGDIIDEDIPADGIVPSGLWVSGIPSKNEYTGNKYTFDFRVYDGNKLLSTNADYSVSYKNNVKAYTLKEGEDDFSAKNAPQVIIKAKGNYSGTKTVYFTIDPADITSSDVETLTTAYTGKVQKLSPTVVFEGKTLKKGTDYILDYPDTAENAYLASGTYNITVTGKGNYTGTRTYQMTIGAEKQISLDKASITLEQKSYGYQNGET